MYAFKFTLLISTLALTACAGYSPYQDLYFNTKAGAAVGAVAGGVLGHQIEDDNGRYIGAAAGALVGGGVGNLMDRQKLGHNQALTEERLRNEQELEQYRRGYSGYQENQTYQGYPGPSSSW